MKPISEIIKPPEVKKSRETEWGSLCDYFLTLNLKDKKGRPVNRGFLGLMLMPYVRGEVGNRNYSLLYALKSSCEHSKVPQAVFWSCVKPKKK
jgi:hypothetical protein